MIIFWLSLCFISILVELFTHNLVSIWIALGAIFASVSTFFTSNHYIQILLFSSLSLSTLLIIKPIIEKYIGKKCELKEIEKTKEFKID